MMKKLLWMAACCFAGALSLSGDSLAGPPPGAAKAAVASPAGRGASVSDGEKAGPSGVVNLNEASAEELAHLPTVGPSRANAIVAYRKAHPFKRPEELMRVKGIGKKSFARLRPLVTLSGPTTLKERPRLAAAPAQR